MSRIRPPMDLEKAKAHARQLVAATQGDPLMEQQRMLGESLAEHLRQREGRDPRVTGDAAIELAACLAGTAMMLGCHDDNAVRVLLNVTTFAGLYLSDDPEEGS